MKYNVSKITLSVLIAMLLGLCACRDSHESQGKHIGKKIDNFENSVKNQAEKGKETAQNAKNRAEKKAQETRENFKETAHEIINKS